MNYYNPNFYQNYPYPQNINQYQGVSAPANTAPTQFSQVLNGKIVDTVDMVKATEVPLGGHGIFPKADFNEIYLKTWNPNGTTSIITFKPIEAPVSSNQENANDIVINEILSKIKDLEIKVDALLKTPVNNTTNKDKEQKGCNLNGF